MNEIKCLSRAHQTSITEPSLASLLRLTSLSLTVQAAAFSLSASRLWRFISLQLCGFPRPTNVVLSDFFLSCQSLNIIEVKFILITSVKTFVISLRDL